MDKKGFACGRKSALLAVIKGGFLWLLKGVACGYKRVLLMVKKEYCCCLRL